MNFCIPKDQIDLLRPRMKALGGAKLVSMSRQELANFFAETVGDKIANNVANSFRNAVLSNRKGALKAWANKTLTIGEAKEVKKIADNLTLEDELYENMDSEIIERSLGVDITEEEVDKINELAKKMEDAYSKDVNKFTGIGENYFEAVKNMNDYVDTINKMSGSQLMFGLIGRGSMLFSVSSGVLNIIGNTVNLATTKAQDAITEVAESFIQKRDFRLKGVNGDLVLDYVAYASKTYFKTGLDIVRVLNAGTKTTVLGEHYKGVGNDKGIARSYGRFMSKWVFQFGQGQADIGFASLQFAHKVDMESTKIADAKGLTGEEHKAEARRLFLMATSLDLDENNPAHDEAVKIKLEAIRYALVATFQNDSALSVELIKIRSKIDDYSGDLMVGTNVVAPFLKTVANIAIISSDMTGVTSPLAIARIVKGVRTGDMVAVKDATGVITRAGLGIVLASLLASLLDDDDYMPDYFTATPAQRELQRTQNIPYNSIKVGNRWVSIAYFGGVGWTLSGILSARNARTKKDAVLDYGMNWILQGLQTPVISYGYDVATYIMDTQRYQKTGEDVQGDIIAGTAGFFMSRFIPSFVPQVAKGIDTKERYIESKQPPLNVVSDTFQSKIPYWRELLPTKYNSFGQPILTESLVSNILAGARLKTAVTNDKVFIELSSLSRNGENVQLGFDTFADMKTLRKIASPKEYNEFRGALQKSMYNSYANTMGTEMYKKADTEKKKELLVANRRHILDTTLRQFGYIGRVKAEQRNEAKLKK